MLGISESEQRNDKRAGIVDDAGPRPHAAGAWRTKFIALAAIIVAWLAADRATKMLVDSGLNRSGSQGGDPILGLFSIHLVYNTGGAWSIFSGATVALGIFSVLMCAALVAFAVMQRERITWPEIIGLALVVAGGLGNALDRFALDHVIDFIDLAFMDFPVFNVADIGVTCGIIVFLIGWLHRQPKEDEQRSQGGQTR